VSDVTITKERYDGLLKCEAELTALENYGVDNWPGYGDAMSDLYGGDEEDEEDDD
jgi:hypothetical protein